MPDEKSGESQAKDDRVEPTGREPSPSQGEATTKKQAATTKAVKDRWYMAWFFKLRVDQWHLCIQLALLVVGTIAVYVYWCQLHAFILATANATNTERSVKMPFIFLTRHDPQQIAASENSSAEYALYQEWTNSGDSRADRPYVQWFLSRNPPWDHPPKPYIEDMSKAGVPVKQKFDSVTIIPLFHEELERLASGRNSLYLYGRIYYDDPYPVNYDSKGNRIDKHVHLVEYALEFSKFSESPDGSLDWGDGKRLDQYCCYDDQCPNQDYKTDPRPKAKEPNEDTTDGWIHWRF